MLLEKSPRISVVVGIDFGTSRSGYAYAFKNWTTEETKIYTRTQWPGQPELYPKTLTQLLYSSDGKVVAWGFEARRKLTELKSQPSATNGYDYFPSFKMELHQQNNSVSIPKLKARSQRDYLVTDLISDYLSLLKEEVMKDLEQNTAGYINKSEIRWCLTIPAIWTDKDKQLMREAARKAGLIGFGYDEEQRLLLTLEPEAAAIHCLKNTHFDLQTDSSFMVVDCGGGTVDITVYKKSETGDLDELAAGTGGAYGSRYVDLEFLSYIKELLTSKLIDDFVEKEPLDYLEILNEWERIKCNYNPILGHEEIRLPIPIKLYRVLEKSPDIIEKLRKVQSGEDTNLKISKDSIEKMFNKVIDGILLEIDKQFSRLKNNKCDYLFLVGGFATSPVLQNKVNQVFGDRVKAIVVPPQPGAAIVEGAVLYGLEPEIYASRIVRVTYACETNNPFRPEIDPVEKKFWHEERRTYYCSNRLSLFVQAGERVEVNQKAVQIFHPIKADQKSVKFNFFISPEQAPQFSDEESVTKIGEFTLDSPDTTNGIDREFEVTFYFGRTEIQVEAVDKNSGVKVETQLKFHS